MKTNEHFRTTYFYKFVRNLHIEESTTTTIDDDANEDDLINGVEMNCELYTTLDKHPHLPLINASTLSYVNGNSFTVTLFSWSTYDYTTS